MSPRRAGEAVSRRGARPRAEQRREDLSAVVGNTVTALTALGLDFVAGEPPARLHPVVWMGRALDWLEARAPRSEPARFMYGGGVAVGLPLAWGFLGWSVERLTPWPVHVPTFKATFAGRALLEAAQRVEEALRAGRLDQARQDLRWLVSRPTADLDANLVAAAAIESLAENLVDSWLGPLLAYALFGLGGAYAYRAVNTADAMWGYRGSPYEWLGKASARLDDLVNWLPARLAALIMVGIGPRRSAAFEIWQRDGHLPASPNAGQPMAVAAAQLHVRLEKVGHYTLHAQAAPPAPDDIAAARRLVGRAMLCTAALALAVRGALAS